MILSVSFFPKTIPEWNSITYPDLHEVGTET